MWGDEFVESEMYQRWKILEQGAFFTASAGIKSGQSFTIVWGAIELLDDGNEIDGSGYTHARRTRPEARLV